HQKLVLGQDRHTERLRFVELRARGVTGDQVRSLRRDGAGRLAPFTLDQFVDLVAREASERPSDDERLAREAVTAHGGHMGWSDAEALHLLDALAVFRGREVE